MKLIYSQLLILLTFYSNYSNACLCRKKQARIKPESAEVFKAAAILMDINTASEITPKATPRHNIESNTENASGHFIKKPTGLNYFGQSPLHNFALRCDFKAIEAAIEEATEEIDYLNANLQDHAGNTPLHFAYAATYCIKHGRGKKCLTNCKERTIQALLKAGASPEIRNSKDRITYDTKEMFQTMIWSMLNFDERTGQTAIHRAVETGDYGFLSELINKISFMEPEKVSEVLAMTDNAGLTALHYAFFKNKSRAKKILMESGASIIINNNNNKTPNKILGSERFNPIARR